MWMLSSLLICPLRTYSPTPSARTWNCWSAKNRRARLHVASFPCLLDRKEHLVHSPIERLLGEVGVIGLDHVETGGFGRLAGLADHRADVGDAAARAAALVRVPDQRVDDDDHDHDADEPAAADSAAAETDDRPDRRRARPAERAAAPGRPARAVARAAEPARAVARAAEPARAVARTAARAASGFEMRPPPARARPIAGTRSAAARTTRRARARTLAYLLGRIVFT